MYTRRERNLRKKLWMHSHASNSPFEKPKRRWEGNKRVHAIINKIGCN